METQNITGVSQFFLKGLTDDPVLQTLLFGLFLSVYLVTIFGNILIILAVSSDTHLQTPMYIFLSNLSFNEICLCTTIIPNMLINIQTQDQSISYTGCFTQVCFVNEFSSLESCILAAMAYDRYMAICFPLSYTAIMNPQFCALLILFSFLMSTVSTAMLCLMELQLSFCTDLEIPLFFCELAQVMNLACSDTLINTIMTYIATLVFGGMPISAIIFSYIQIVLSVLKISSLRGRYKAFSTCGSHLSAVSLFYGAAFWVYISSVFTDSHKKIEVAYVMYTMVPEMLNPFIYSLRNKDMKGTLKKLIRRYCPFYDM